MSKMLDLLSDVREERIWQKAHWGDEHDQDHEVTDWIAFIDQRLSTLNNDGDLSKLRRRLLFVKIAALAVAAAEALEAKGS